eukprot:4074657-Prymnesium_polylepis.1
MAAASSSSRLPALKACLTSSRLEQPAAVVAARLTAAATAGDFITGAIAPGSWFAVSLWPVRRSSSRPTNTGMLMLASRSRARFAAMRAPESVWSSP